MSAPRNVYLQKLTFPDGSGGTIIVYSAMTLADYVSMERFMELFHLDRVVTFPYKNSSGAIEYGVVGCVLPGSQNALHHNISEQQQSRLSRLRIPGFSDDCKVLNDAGLNTTPDVTEGLFDVKFKNVYAVNMTVLSAYYLQTSGISVEVNGRAVEAREFDFPGSGSYSTFPIIAQRVSMRFLGRLQELHQDANDLTLNIRVTNEEGTFPFTATAVTWPEHLHFPFALWLEYDAVPTTYEQYRDNGRTVTLYISQEDFDQLPQVGMGDSSGNPSGTPSVQPHPYTDYYLGHGSGNRYPAGKWLTNGDVPSDKMVTFYHIGTHNYIDCYYRQRIAAPTGYIDFLVSIMSSPFGGDYPYQVVCVAKWMDYADEGRPTSVVVVGTLTPVNEQGVEQGSTLKWQGSYNTHLQEASVVLSGSMPTASVSYFAAKGSVQPAHLWLEIKGPHSEPRGERVETRRVQIY